MRKKALAVLPILLLCLFASCRKNEADILFYQEKPFAGELEVVLKDITFTARVSGGEWSAEAGEKRDIIIEFTAPQTLEGIILTREGGKESAVVNGVPFEVDGNAMFSLAFFADFFELTAVPSDLSVEGKNTRANLSLENGNSISLLLDQNGLPVEISDGNITVKVLSFVLK